MKKILFLFLFSFIFSNLISQNLIPINNNQNYHLNIDGLRENSIAIDNSNEDMPILVTAHNYYYTQNNKRVRMFITPFKFSVNWEEIFVTDNESVDPVVMVDNNNNYYCIYLDNPDNSNDCKLMMMKRVDGVNYYYIVTQGEGQLDKPHACIDLLNNIYVTYLKKGIGTLFVKKSSDGGDTWSQIYSYNLDVSGFPNHGPNIIAGSNNDIFLTWTQGGNIKFNFYKNNNWLSSPLPLGQGGFNTDFPSTCVNINSGYIYCVYSNNNKLLFTSSSTGGVNWSTPIEINGNSGDKKMPWISANSLNNCIAIVCYKKNINNKYNTCIISSFDNGLNWSEDLIISSSDFNLSDMTGNDYIGISNSSYYFYPIWSDDRTGNYKVYLQSINLSYNVKQNITSTEPLFSISPNPFNPDTRIKFTITEKSFVNIIVYDITGKKVDLLANSYYNTGSYEVILNGNNLNSGIYFCKLTISGKIFTKKVVLIK